MAKPKSTGQHSFAVKVSDILERLKIPEAKRDKHGNPLVRDEYLTKLPDSVHVTLETKGLHRICIRPYKQ